MILSELQFNSSKKTTFRFYWWLCLSEMADSMTPNLPKIKNLELNFLSAAMKVALVASGQFFHKNSYSKPQHPPAEDFAIFWGAFFWGRIPCFCLRICDSKVVVWGEDSAFLTHPFLHVCLLLQLRVGVSVWKIARFFSSGKLQSWWNRPTAADPNLRSKMATIFWSKTSIVISGVTCWSLIFVGRWCRSLSGEWSCHGKNHNSSHDSGYVFGAPSSKLAIFMTTLERKIQLQWTTRNGLDLTTCSLFATKKRWKSGGLLGFSHRLLELLAQQGFTQCHRDLRHTAAHLCDFLCMWF